MAKFRIYNKLDCNIFDLLGHKEPSQTKALGFLLSRSWAAMEVFLKLIGKSQSQIRRFKKYNYIVNCEMPTKKLNGNYGRVDIVIRFFDKYSPKEAFIIEAKSSLFNSTNIAAGQQVQSYPISFCGNINRITLTREAITINNGINDITWQQLIAQFSRISDKCVSDFTRYIINIQTTMHYFEEEIMTLPAGASACYVDQCGLYECPSHGKQYSARGNKKVLFLAFRKKGGEFSKLYKIHSVLKIDIGNQADIDDADNLMSPNGNQVFPNIKQCIAKYKQLAAGNPKVVLNGEKYVFLLDLTETITLPAPVKYQNSSKRNQNHEFLKLKDVLKQPKNGYVLI